MELEKEKPKSSRTKVNRIPPRGFYDLKTICEILDEGLVCHVGFSDGEQPYVIPTIYGRIESEIFLHGSVASRMLKALGEGRPACITVTLLDGLVLARSVFHHSMNYRSVVILGKGRSINDPDLKMNALKAITDQVMKGRWEDARLPNENEFKVTSVVGFSINEASAKIRTGPPVDLESDYLREIWAGVLPLEVKPGDPVPDPRIVPNQSIPHYMKKYRLY